MPLVVVTIFKKLSKEVLADPTAAFKIPCQFFRDVKGCHGFWHGVSHEDKNLAFAVVVWESHKHYDVVTAAPDYPEAVGLGDAIGIDRTVLHIKARAAPEGALNANVTETLNITLKPSKTMDDLEAVLDPLMAELGQEKGCTPGTWGQAGEDKEQFMSWLGWVSIERHYQVIGEEKYKKLVAAFGDVADINMNHVAYKRY